MNEGYQLKLKIKALDKTQEQAATALGMTRQNLALLFNKTKLDDDLKQNVKEVLGISLDNFATIGNEDRQLYLTAKDELILSLKKNISTLEDVVEMQKQKIAQLEAQVNGTVARKSA